MKQRMARLLMSCLLLFLANWAVAQEAPTRLGFSHIVLPIRELNVSLPFYRNLLGLPSVAVPGTLASSQAWFDVGGGQQLQLVEKRTDSGSGSISGSSGLRTNGLLVALRVGSLRTAEQQLRQRGATVTRQTNAAGKASLQLTDPDGYLIEISEAKAAKPGFLQAASKWVWKSITTVD